MGLLRPWFLVILIELADWNSFLQKTMTFDGSIFTSSYDYTSFIQSKLLLQSTSFGEEVCIYYFRLYNFSIIYLYQQYQNLSTMNSFGVTLFRQPQEFIALYLGKNTETKKFLEHLEKALQRTKSPPIAITYTYHFLKDKTEEQVSLDVIRFISQLADVSVGVSMSSSLQGILNQSSFLTQLRHNLTHKTMVKGSILLLSKSMIVEELQTKYWKVTVQKIKETYFLDQQKVRNYYQEIYGKDYNQILDWLISPKSIDYFINCSNYEFKEHIQQILILFKQTKIEKNHFLEYYLSVSQQKQIIFIAIILKQYIEKNDFSCENFSNFVLNFIPRIKSNLYSSEMVLRQCYKSYFLRYLPHSKSLYEALPTEIQSSIEAYWSKKETLLGQKLYNYS